MPTDTAPAEELYPCAIAVFCDDCGTEVRHDYVVSDHMDKLERHQVARNHLAKNEGWLCDKDDDLCRNCRPFPGLLRQAAQFLRDIAWDLLFNVVPRHPLAGLADGVAKWLDDVADLHEPHQPGCRGRVTPGCQWCGDEDWPCSDMRHALNVARVCLGGKRETIDAE